jgi:hypothetical protein
MTYYLEKIDLIEPHTEETAFVITLPDLGCSSGCSGSASCSVLFDTVGTNASERLTDDNPRN